jgi:hypothetical protein
METILYCDRSVCMYVCHDLRISNNSIWMNFVLFCLSKPGLPLRKRWSRDSLSFKLISRSFARKNAKMHAGNSNPNGPIWTISFFVRLHKGYLQQKDDNWIRWPSGSMSRSFAWKSTTTQITRTWMVWCGRFLFLYVHFHMSYFEENITTKFLDLQGHFQCHSLGKVQNCRQLEGEEFDVT